MNTTHAEKDIITLKWGTLKAWDLHTPKCQELLQKWAKLGYSFSAAMHRDTPEQKEIICQIIDKSDADTIYLDWDGKEVSKEEAKRYVMEYGLSPDETNTRGTGVSNPNDV